jgi:hypothetical protein
MPMNVVAEPKAELSSSMADTRRIPLDDLKRASRDSLQRVSGLAEDTSRIAVAAFNSAL